MNSFLNKSIIYICPGSTWSTRQRSALRDIEIAREVGNKVIVYVTKDSFFEKNLNHLGIPTIHIEPHFLSRLTKFHDHVAIGKIIKEHKIDIVHCYDFAYLFSLSLQLQRNVLVSFVLTQDHIVEKQLRKFWYRPIITRIDSLILLSKHLKNDALGGLQLPVKKIEYFGMGLYRDGDLVKNDPEIEIQFENYFDSNLVGCYISPAVESIKDINSVLSAFYVIKTKNPNSHNTKLVLFSTVSFKEIPVFEELTNFIKEHELNNDLLFVTTHDIKTVQKKMKLWISIDKNDLLEDYSITAVLNEIPILIPRNFCSTEVLREYQGVGEVYKLGDARELREKWEQIIASHHLYEDKTKVFKYFFEKEYSVKNYKANLIALYTRIIQRRTRLFKK